MWQLEAAIDALDTAVDALRGAEVNPRGVPEGPFEAMVGELAVTGLRILREAMTYSGSEISWGSRRARFDDDGGTGCLILESLAGCARLLDPDGDDLPLRLAAMLLVADPGKFAGAMHSVQCMGTLCDWHRGSAREKYHALFEATA